MKERRIFSSVSNPLNWANLLAYESEATLVVLAETVSYRELVKWVWEAGEVKKRVPR